METLTPLAKTVMRVSMPAVALSCAAAAFVDTSTLAGVLLGVTAGYLAFFLKIRAAKRAARHPRGGVPSIFLFWARYALYAAVLYRAYRIDPAEWMGFLGAAPALLLIPVTTKAVGYAGMDMPRRTGGLDLDRGATPETHSWN